MGKLPVQRPSWRTDIAPVAESNGKPAKHNRKTANKFASERVLRDEISRQFNARQSTQFRVLWCIFSMADGTTRTCTVSPQMIADRVGIHKRNVQRIINVLVARKLISKVRQGGSAGWKANTLRYEF